MRRRGWVNADLGRNPQILPHSEILLHTKDKRGVEGKTVVGLSAVVGGVVYSNVGSQSTACLAAEADTAPLLDSRRKVQVVNSISQRSTWTLV